MTFDKLYESIQKYDFFDLKEEDFDWSLFLNGQNQFFELHSLDPELNCLLESFEKIKESNPTEHGREDVYEIKLHNGLVFFLHLNYIEFDEARSFLKTKVTNSEFKQANDLANSYISFYDDLKDGKSICMMMFTDSEKNTKLTGNVGISAKELFIALKNAFLDSISQRKNISAIGIRVAIGEEKRINFYKLLFEKFLKDRFPVVLEDKITEKEQGNYLLFFRDK